MPRNPNKTKASLLANIKTLSVLDVRTLNRYYLHQEDKRVCHSCRQIIVGIRENFRIKRQSNGQICWVPSCNNCSKSINNSLSATRRKDPVRFITSKLSSYACRARNQNIPFNLDAQYLIDLWQSQEGKCFYTLKEIDFTFIEEDKKGIHPFQPSLDKKNPSLGYVKGNVVWCSSIINLMKNKLDYDDFIAACELIVSTHTKNSP